MNKSNFNNYQNKNRNQNRNEVKNNLDLRNVFEAAKNNKYNVFVEEAEKFAKNNKDISNSQLRKFYDEVSSKEKLNKNNFQKVLPFLKVKLAYALGRGNIKQDFYKNMVMLIDETLKSEENIVIFQEFFEAIVAYNKSLNK